MFSDFDGLIHAENAKNGINVDENNFGNNISCEYALNGI